jgi:hypothetical protein
MVIFKKINIIKMPTFCYFFAKALGEMKYLHFYHELLLWLAIQITEHVVLSLLTTY